MTPIPKKHNNTSAFLLSVEPAALDNFTTLLQAGFFLQVRQGETIGGLLTALPGFTMEYIRQRVQTIFLNGFPADDIEQQIFGTDAVLAISAAMPGLAGAIFRKGGVHASLRTTAEREVETSIPDAPVTIRLKLFNIIARERGEEILADACLIEAATLKKFLAYRPPLLAAIRKVEINMQTGDTQDLINSLDNESMIRLTIRSTHGS